MTLSEPGARLRRNGKQQSCEPCRLSKLRCDHALPCSRCVRRKRESHCTYHPAPMSKTARAISQQLPSPPQDLSSDLSQPDHSRTDRESWAEMEPLEQERRETYLKRGPGRISGYMGTTAHSALFVENEHDLGPDIRKDSVASNPDNSCQTCLAPISTQLKLQNCNKILSHLPELSVAKQAIEYLGPITCWDSTAFRTVQHWLKEFEREFGEVFKSCQKSHDFTQLIRHLNRNTESTLPVPTTNDGWLSSFSGINSRWEAIGLLFIWLGYSVLLQDRHPCVRMLVSPGGDKHAFCAQMLECAEQCLKISEKLAEVDNLLTIYLQQLCVVLCSVIGGDGSTTLWKAIGTLMCSVTAFGLHKVSPDDTKSPCSLIYIQLKRVAFADSFMLDKCVATYVGRPPLLSRRYIDIQLPFDATFEELMEGDIEKIQRNADINGWRLDSKILKGTLIRIFYLSSVLRDEVLELSLGPVNENIGERVRKLRGKVKDFYASIPETFKSPIKKANLEDRSRFEFDIIAQVQLVYFQHTFLLERVQHAERSEEQLQSSARDMLKIVLMMWHARDDGPDYRDVVHWDISAFGVPAASALSIALLKSSKHPQIHQLYTDRSETIRDLSVFVSALDWLRESDGNYASCMKARELISHILDRVLAPQPSVAEPTPPESFDFDFLNMSNSSLPPFPGGMDNLLDVPDWMNMPWMGWG